MFYAGNLALSESPVVLPVLVLTKVEADIAQWDFNSERGGRYRKLLNKGSRLQLPPKYELLRLNVTDRRDGVVSVQPEKGVCYSECDEKTRSIVLIVALAVVGAIIFVICIVVGYEKLKKQWRSDLQRAAPNDQGRNNDEGQPEADLDSDFYARLRMRNRTEGSSGIELSNMTPVASSAPQNPPPVEPRAAPQVSSSINPRRAYPLESARPVGAAPSTGGINRSVDSFEDITIATPPRIARTRGHADDGHGRRCQGESHRHDEESMRYRNRR